MYHYFPIGSQKTYQYQRNFFSHSYIRNLIVSRNKALIFNSKKKSKKIFYSHDQKGLTFLKSNFASSSYLDK